MEDIKIEKAIEIEDGKTYVLELDQQLSFEQIAVIQKTWKEATNSKLIVLQAGAKLARVGEDEIREQIAKEIEDNCTPDDSGSIHAWEFSGELKWKKCTCDDSVWIIRGRK